MNLNVSKRILNISELLPDEPIPDPFKDEIDFNNTIREYVLFGVLLVVLSIASHIIISIFKRRDTTLSQIYTKHSQMQIDQDEAVVDRVALWLCTFSLSIAIGAALLLPVSIFCNEVLAIYGEDSFYVRWLNISFIQGMWNTIFLFSNLSLFAFLPFAYLFTESEGFPSSKKGLRARITETVVVLSLLVVLVLGVSFFLSLLLGYYEEESLFDVISVLQSFYLPFVYSLISCLGVLFLLLCTPTGITHCFSILGQLILKPPGFLSDLKAEFEYWRLEEETLSFQVFKCKAQYAAPLVGRKGKMLKIQDFDGHHSNKELLEQYLKAQISRKKYERLMRTSHFERILAYPIALLVLLALTGTSVLIAVLNGLQLLVGIKALPLASTPALLGEAQLGKRMVLLSILGPMGALLELVLIFYLAAASVVGCYALPGLRDIRPTRRDTPMTHIILNCGLLLILSSALPLIARTIGITNFDLLGDYGKISWLGNLWIVLGYNVVFVAAAAWCLFVKFTQPLRQGILLRFKHVWRSTVKEFYFWPLSLLYCKSVITDDNAAENMYNQSDQFFQKYE